MALTPVFVSIIEPSLSRRRPRPIEVGMSLAVLPGVALVVGGTPAGMRDGIAVGAFSAFVAGLFSTLNKRTVRDSPALTMTGLQMAAGAALLPAIAWLLPAGEHVLLRPDLRDGLLLIALSMACTLLPYALALVALRHLSAFDTTLAVNMEPVYSIVLAAVLLNEQRDLKPSFYFGVLLIIGIVFTHFWLSRRAAVRRGGSSDPPASAGEPEGSPLRP
jgi:drug/metabolite transporter (DMT)-like permease